MGLGAAGADIAVVKGLGGRCFSCRAATEHLIFQADKVSLDGKI